jgi:hypothetical protein
LKIGQSFAYVAITSISILYSFVIIVDLFSLLKKIREKWKCKERAASRALANSCPFVFFKKSKSCKRTLFYPSVSIVCKFKK